MKFASKGETLASLENRLRSAKVLPQIRGELAAWPSQFNSLWEQIVERGWDQGPLIVRSNSLSEDSARSSLAGHYTSILDVRGQNQLQEAIQAVCGSLETGDSYFIQPQLSGVKMAGVAFSKDLHTCGPYVVINYDESGSTDTVTSGAEAPLAVYTHFRDTEKAPPSPELGSVLELLRELEVLFEDDCLDIEFALDDQNQLYLFQVRPLTGLSGSAPCPDQIKSSLARIESKIRQRNGKHPYLYGSQTVFGVMPDWNPAEIIGLRPKPLAFSLYRELITDAIWAYQRDNYGYLNLRSFPLIHSFAGLPYVDVRVSFNSFVPKTLEPQIAERLVDFYLDRLIERPELHDKVEFEVVYSCYTLDLPQRLERLLEFGFSSQDCQSIADSLRALTTNIIDTQNGLWRTDLKKIEKLEARQRTVLESDLTTLHKIYWLLEDCKRYGTLPFAGLARAGFIAVQLLNSMVSVGVMTRQDAEAFMLGLDTISGRMTRDFTSLERDQFLATYGHLRPDTYNILSPRYDEEPERYFDWNDRGAAVEAEQPPGLRREQSEALDKLLKSHQLQGSAQDLIEFITAGIEGREYAKFVFSRSLSEALRLLGELGAEQGFSREALSYLDCRELTHLYTTSEPVSQVFERSITAGRELYQKMQGINLPPLLVEPQDVWGFHTPKLEPNFVTQGSAVAEPVVLTGESDKVVLSGRIVFIEKADPGFDWIFSHRPAGLVTRFGGVNSHMAIRAGEKGLPAVIGAGRAYFESWSSASLLELDCNNRRVKVLR